MNFTHTLDLLTDIANFSLENTVHETKQAPSNVNDCMYKTGLNEGKQLVAEHPGAAITGFDNAESKDGLVQAQQDCGFPSAPEPPPIHIPSPSSPLMAFFEVLLTPSEANWGEDHALAAGRASGSYKEGLEEGTGYSAVERAYWERDAANGYIELGPPASTDAHAVKSYEPPVNTFDAFIQQHYSLEINNHHSPSSMHSDASIERTQSLDNAQSSFSSSDGVSGGGSEDGGGSNVSSASGGSNSAPDSE